MNMMQGEGRGGEGAARKGKFRSFLLFFFPPLSTPVSPANCLLTKSGDRATIFVKACGVGWGPQFSSSFPLNNVTLV